MESKHVQSVCGLWKHTSWDMLTLKKAVDLSSVIANVVLAFENSIHFKLESKPSIYWTEVIRYCCSSRTEEAPLFMSG
jgi:hypothetical protein